MRYLYALVIFIGVMQCYAMKNRVFHSDETLPLKKRKITSTYDISVPSMIGKICIALNQKNVRKAKWWYALLNKKMYIDWQFLNEKQITAFADLNYDLYCKIDSIQPPEMKKLPPQPHQNTYANQARDWVRHAVEANADTTLIWRAAFDDTQANKPIPSPQLLKKHRLEQLDKNLT